MYVTMSNPDQYANNTLMLAAPLANCCGTDGKTPIARFRAKFDTGTIASVDEVVINGVIYPFVTARDPLTAAGRAGIISEVDDIVTTLIGTHSGGLVISLSGTTVYVTTPWTELKFESIGAGSNAIFMPTDGSIIGLADSTNAGFYAKIKLNTAGTDYEVRIKPLAGGVITSFIVDYAGGADEYNAAWPKPSAYSLPAGTTLDKGSVKFDVLKATGDAGATFVVTVVVGGVTTTYSQTLILADYVGQ